MEQERVIDKIQKLLRLANSSNEHEAALAAERASDLIKKHQISMSMMDVDKEISSGVDRFAYAETVISRRWVSSLAYACAKLFDGFVVQSSATQFSFVGFKDDMTAARELFTHLYKSWFGIADFDAYEEKKSRALSGGRFSGAKYRNSHGFGYAAAISRRVAELLEQRNREFQEASEAGTALIVLKSKSLREYRAREGFKTRTRSVSVSDGAGRSAGTAAGHRAALGGAISN